MYRAAAVGEAEKAAFGVGDLDLDATAACLVDDDARIGIELVVGFQRGGKQLLVNRVLALDREDGDAAKAELFIKRDGLLVVVHHRQVEIGGTARLEVFGEPAHQHLADARMTCLRVDGKAPQRRRVLGVVEGARMIDPGHRADDLAGRLLLRDEIGDRAAVALRPEEIRPHGHHPARGIDGVDGFGIAFRRQAANEIAARLAAARAIGREIEAVCVGRVEENFLRRQRKKNMRIADIEGDVAPPGAFVAQRLDDPGIGRVCLREDQPPPPAIERDGFAPSCLAILVLADRRLHRIVAHALQAMAHRLLAARPMRPGVAVALSRHRLRSHASEARVPEGRPATARTPSAA